MDSSTDYRYKRCCNILALDGGGVRGLSSLLILRDLMQHINATIQSAKYTEESYENLEPHDVFDLVTGTSTGGLIAIMLGKLGMTLEKSIQAYHDLSKRIFSKKHLRGRITHGLAPTKYSGSRLRSRIQDLIRSKGFAADLPMVSNVNGDKIACAVVCREHSHQSKYSPFKPDAVPICSLQCHQEVPCLVFEAARATSAAPTFFPVQRIGDRYFVDGGMEHNNPSHAIFDHYVMPGRVAQSRNPSAIAEEVSAPAHHGCLDFSRVRIVNLGTGTRSNDLPPRQRDYLAELVPGFIRMGLFMKRTLTEFAVNSELTASKMTTLAHVSGDSVNYERFSADNGVCYIKLDRYKRLNDIETMTTDYLQTSATRNRLRKVGEEMAKDFLQKRRLETAGKPVSPTNMTESITGTPLAKIGTSQTLVPFEKNPSASTSSDSSGENAEGSHQTGQNQSNRDREARFNFTSPIPSRIGTGRFPAGVGMEQNESMAEPRMLKA